MPNRELGTSNGSGPRRGVQTDGGDRPEMGRLSGSGAQPREIFKRFICHVQAKLAYHTTYRTLTAPRWKAHIQKTNTKGDACCAD